MSDETPSRIDYLRQSIAASRESFEKVGKATTYIFSRGLTRSIGTEQTYEKYLPKFHHKTIVEVLKEKTQHIRPPQEVTYLDIGYGNGQALLEAKQMFGDVMRPIGYGTSHQSKVAYAIDGIMYPPTYDDLITQNIRLIEGNVLDIRQMIPDNSIDVVSALHSLDYTELPYWEVIQKIYKILKPGGVAFISNVYISNRKELQDYLRAQGYDFQIYEGDIAFKKTIPHLPSGIRTRTGNRDETQRVELPEDNE